MANSPRPARRRKRGRASLTPPESQDKRPKSMIIVSDSESEAEWQTDPESQDTSASKSSTITSKAANSGLKKSWVWTYFITKDKDGKKSHICQVKKDPNGDETCGCPIAWDRSSSTKSMSRHLDRKHGISPPVEVEESAIDLRKYMTEGRVCKVSDHFLFYFLSIVVCLFIFPASFPPPLCIGPQAQCSNLQGCSHPSHHQSRAAFLTGREL